jgi:ubiquinone biosynthesis protein UbiJ
MSIRRLAEVIRSLRERTIPNTDDIAAFDDAVSNLRAAWATLDVASLNDDVVAFLRAANSDRGASLSQLTGPVQTWLAERRLESHYVIRPSDS